MKSILLFCFIYQTDHVSKGFSQELSSVFMKLSYVLDLNMWCDINMQLEIPNCPVAEKFEGLVSSYRLKQVASLPTHKFSHTTDVVITLSKNQCNIGRCGFKSASSISWMWSLSHLLVFQEKNFRNIKNIVSSLFWFSTPYEALHYVTGF